MMSGIEKAESGRARKRRETQTRIAATGLKLFLAHGYEATTLDMIAAAADISRRTFFSYFKSKEDVLVAYHGSGFPEALGPAIRQESADQRPLDAVRNCLVKLASRYETKESILIDRLLRSNDVLRIRKQASFVDMEETLFEGLRVLWPAPGRYESLRMVAMIAMGTLRIAMDNWRRDDARHSLARYLEKGFAVLDVSTDSQVQLSVADA